MNKPLIIPIPIAAAVSRLLLQEPPRLTEGTRVRLYELPYQRKYWDGTVTCIASDGVSVEWDDGVTSLVANPERLEVIES